MFYYSISHESILQLFVIIDILFYSKTLPFKHLNYGYKQGSGNNRLPFISENI